MTRNWTVALGWSVYYFMVCDCNAQETKSGTETALSVHASPQRLFTEFSRRHNAGRASELLPLIAPKTKASLLFSHIYKLGMAPKDIVEKFEPWTRKWEKSIHNALKGAELDWRDDYSPVMLPLSKWDKLDECLKDALELKSDRVAFPLYGAEVKNLKAEDLRAVGNLTILVNGGIIAGLDGNSLKWIDVDPISVYFVRIDESWFVCNEQEYLGKYQPKSNK